MSSPLLSYGLSRPTLMTKKFIRPNTLNKQRSTLVRMKIELKSFLEPLIKGQNSDTVVVNEISANQKPQIRSFKMLNRDRVILKQRILLTVLLFFSMFLLFFANRFVLRSFSVNAAYAFFISLGNTHSCADSL